MGKETKTITSIEFLKICASIVAGSKANPIYHESVAKVKSCIELARILLDELNFEIKD